MTRRRRPASRILLSLIACLLFQQVAMAAYACPLERMPATTLATAESCAGMHMQQTQENPALCAENCAPDHRLLADHAAPVVPALALPPTLFAPLPMPALASLAATARGSIHRSDPPPRLRFCSLLI